MSQYTFFYLVIVGLVLGGIPVLIHVFHVLKYKREPNLRVVWSCFAIPILALLFNAWTLQYFAGPLINEEVQIGLGFKSTGILTVIPPSFWAEPILFLLAVATVLSTGIAAVVSVITGDLAVYLLGVYSRLRMSYHTDQL